MLIDTHAHLNFPAYKVDAQKVIDRTLKKDVWMINIGTNYHTSKKAVEISQKYKKGIYATVGLHPIYAQDGFDDKKYKQLAQNSNVVAIGEIGLDYKKEYLSFKKEQEILFLKQIKLAQELKLPIIFHCRMAHQDLINFLILNNKNQKPKLKGVIHCFTGNLEEAKKYLEMGFYLGFNGLIFKLNFDNIIKSMPLEKILIETDCPYLTPLQEGNKRNEPLFIKYIVEKIAKIKNIDSEKVAKIVTKNAKTLFKI